MPLNVPPSEYNNFARSLAFVLKWEGGYVNDPKDPGGETKWGISKRSHPTEDIKNLTPERAAEIYYNDYWSKTLCPGLDYPLCVVAFDSAVNCGPARSDDWTKKSGGSAPEYLNLRKDYYVSLVQSKPNLGIYLKGWINRVLDLSKLVALPE